MAAPREEECARLTVPDAPEWLPPLLRGALMLDVPVLAAETYVEHFDHGPLPAEVRWKRWQLLPLRTVADRALLTLRASNVLHSCRIMSDPDVTLAFAALTHVDEFKDPLLPAAAGMRYRLELLPGIRVEATPHASGNWQLQRCDAGGFEFCTSMEALCEDVQRWSLAVETPSPLTAMARAVWRFQEPAAAGGRLAWCHVTPAHSEWSARLEDGRAGVVLRRLAGAECVEDNAAVTRALRALREVTVEVVGAGVVLAACAAGAAADAVVRADPEEEEFVLVALPAAATQLGARIWARHTWAIVPDARGACTLLPFKARNDTIVITGASVHATPPGVRPALQSPACWEHIPLCHLRRGDCVRAEATARLGVGAAHARYAAACGGVSTVLEHGTLTMEVEAVGQLDAPALVEAMKASALAACERYARSVAASHPDEPPPPYFPDRTQPGRRAAAPPPEPVHFRCLACGATTKQQAACRLCGKTVMEKTRRHGVALHLQA